MPASVSSYTSPSTESAVRSDGRWGGRVTSRPLPELLPTGCSTELSEEQRLEVASIWLTQASTEARVAHSFEVVHHALVRLGADPGLVHLAKRAVDDEHRHAALCEEVAGRYAGRVVGPYRALSERRPEHPGASAELRHVLHVVGQCCLNETFATAYLSAAQAGAQTPLVKRAIQELLSDEVDHARVGWGFVHTLSPELRGSLEQWLLPLVVCNLREWRLIDLPDDDALAGHGVPPHGTVQQAITETLHGVVIPGLAHVGLNTRDLEAWAADGAHVPPLSAPGP